MKNDIRRCNLGIVTQLWAEEFFIFWRAVLDFPAITRVRNKLTVTSHYIVLLECNASIEKIPCTWSIPVKVFSLQSVRGFWGTENQTKTGKERSLSSNTFMFI